MPILIHQVTREMITEFDLWMLVLSIELGGPVDRERFYSQWDYWAMWRPNA